MTRIGRIHLIGGALGLLASGPYAAYADVPAAQTASQRGPQSAPRMAPLAASSVNPCHKTTPADGAPQTRTALAADVEALRAANGPVKTNWTPPGETLRFGHAEIWIDAPVADVLRQVRSYANYKDLAPRKFRQSRVIDKDGENTDVYMQVPLINGLIVLWQVMRFGPPVLKDARTTIVDGKYIRGNLKTARVTFTLRRQGPDQTVLACDLLIALDVPAPQEMVDEELRDAAGDALLGIRDKAQAQVRARQASPMQGTPSTSGPPTSATPTSATPTSATPPPAATAAP